MFNSTTNTYQMKREILNFSNKISKHLSKPDKKFSADMTYGMLAAGSCLLTDVMDQLHENTKKVNSVERLTRHLNNGTSSTALKSYLNTIRKWVPVTQLRNQRKGRILCFSLIQKHMSRHPSSFLPPTSQKQRNIHECEYCAEFQ